MRFLERAGPVCVLGAVAMMACGTAAAGDPAAVGLWDMAKANQGVHRFSTLFTAQQVRDHLSTDGGIDAAIDWCRKTAVTKVYIEVFRDGYQAQRDALRHAKERFTVAGFEVSGCVTTTKVGKPTTGWRGISCYTDQATQKRLQEIFELAAGLFDETMIDDFWFTDCKCPQCDAARKALAVTVGERTYPVAGDRWEDYRCELMVRISQERLLAAAKRVNPKATLIIKYPQWYDAFHERGYEVLRETADFDRTWVGTETRDYGDKRWGGTPQYEAYFIMRWLGRIGGAKCGGGWYDPYGTTERTYLEQARQTVLGGARESLLFCYGSLLDEQGTKNVNTLRQNIPELLTVAGQVGRRRIVGVAAYKPANSHPEKERRVFDFIGMLGLPLVPCHEFPVDAPAAFFSVHAMKDPELPARLARFIASGKPVLLTDGLAAQLVGKVNLTAANVHTIAVASEPKRLLELPQKELDSLRLPLLRPLGTSLRAPARVALYLFADGSWVIENFNDEPVVVELGLKKQQVAARGWAMQWTPASGSHAAAPREQSAAVPPAASAENCFLFSYFIGNGEDGLHLARSSDGYRWKALNRGRSFLVPKVGKSKLMRDPCLLRGPDGTFQMVWTDSWNSRTIGHASSKDLIRWSPQQAVEVMAHEPQAMNCWAPEIVFDEGNRHYVIFWSTTIPGRFPKTDSAGDGRYNHRIYCTTTKDFKSFTPTRLFYDGGFNVIDATMLRAGSKVHLIVKDETLKPVKKNLRIAEGVSPEGPFGDAYVPFTPSWVEGPTAIRIGDDYLVYFDCYTKGHYGAMRSRNLKDWEDVTSRLAFPKGARHGTVLRVTKVVVDRLDTGLYNDIVQPGQVDR